MATVHSTSEAYQFADIPSIGLLNSKALPDGLNTVYLQGKLYKITDKKGSEPRIACTISLLNHLENGAGDNFSRLKEEKRIGVLHVEDGKIKSLTISRDQIKAMQDSGINEIAFKVNNMVLIIKDNIILREFTSEDEYQRYTDSLQQNLRQ